MYYLSCMITTLSKVTFLIVTVMTGQSHNARASFFYQPKPNQPKALLLWHPSQPLPVSTKLPACSLLHQEPQEMSLRERWSLIKNKWMGCPRDRVNGEWEREGERIAGTGALKWEERRRRKKNNKVSSLKPLLCFCTVMNQVNQNQLRRGVLLKQEWQHGSTGGSFKTF